MGLAQLLDGSYSEWKSVMDNCAVSDLLVGPEPKLLRFRRRAGHGFFSLHPGAFDWRPSGRYGHDQ